MQKKLSTMRGFTLIELLVVIAIIGILSAVVLASLNTARQKGSDGAIQSDVKTVSTQGAIYYSDNSNYGAAIVLQTVTSPTGFVSTGGTNMFNSDKTTASALNQAVKNGGSVVYAVGVNGMTFAVAAQLNAKTSGASPVNKWFCVDDSGTAKTLLAAPTASTLGGGSSKAQCP